MTDENKGGFGGPKKPKPTFGDVMLGIPSGGKDRDGGGGRDGGKGGGRGGERKAQGRDERPRDEKPREEKKSGGPMVTVRRAGGGVETRQGDAPAEGVSSETAADSVAAQAPAPKAERVAPAPINSALFEEVPEDQSFAEMYAESAKNEGPGRRSLKVGDKVKAKIFQLGADTAFLSVGGKSEAMIELSELKDDEGILRFGVGDEVEAHVAETGAKGIILSRKLSKGAASLARLYDAKLSGIPVEGLVLSVNKGGLEVAVGEVRAFCPASQVDVRFVGKLDSFVGEKLVFRVTEVKDGKSVVLSRRSLLEEEQKAKAAELRKSLAVGSVLKGSVVSVQNFGAFVDLGGLEGMIPVSELSHTRVGSARDVVKEGDEVEVEVLRMEAAQPDSPDKAKRKERITLSMRSRQEDPWKAVAEEFKEGTQLKGKVVRLQPFGAFVELKAGVDGLIHVSAMSDKRIAHPRDVLQVGQEVEVVVEKVDTTEKRVGLRLMKDGQPVGGGFSAAQMEQKEAAGGDPAAPKAPRPKRGQVVKGKVERVEQFGIFIAFEGGKGLIPASETGTDRGTDLRRVFPLGTEVTAAIIEADGQKLKLSIPEAQRVEERADLEAWKKTQTPAAGGGKAGFGTLADKFKGLNLK